MKTYTGLTLVSQLHKNVQDLYGDVMKKTGLDVSVVYDVAKDAITLPNSIDTGK